MKDPDDKSYKRDIIKTEWFYVGKTHEKKTAMFNKKEHLQDKLNHRIDNRKSRKEWGAQAFLSLELKEHGLNFSEISHNHPMFNRLSKNQLILDHNLKGYFRGGEKKLRKAIDEFKKSEEYINHKFKKGQE